MQKTLVIKDFEDNILSIKHKKNENEIQTFLLENPDLIPTPYLSNHNLHFNFIFSKLAIYEEYKSDFAYLTKSSVEWEMVLMELEASNKSIFNNNKKNIYFSAEFNNAYDQILSWRAYLNDHKQEFKSKLTYLMSHMANNPMSFKFVLVIGRSDELNTNERINMFAQKNKDGIIVMTYDSLIRAYLSNKRRYRNIISKVKNGFELKSYNSEAPTSAFAHLKPGNFFFDSTIKAKLIADGYDLPSWENGNLLSINGKLPISSFTGKVVEDFMINEIDD